MEKLELARANLKAMKARHEAELKPLRDEVNRLRVRKARGLPDCILDERTTIAAEVEAESEALHDAFPG